MSKAKILVTGLLLATGLSFCQSIKVIQPNGGEKLTSRSDYMIRWNAAGTTHPFKITLWKNNLLVGIVASEAPAGNGIMSFNWKVGNLEGGAGAAPGPGYMIKVKEKNVPVEDMSDAAFQIMSAFCTTISPQPGTIVMLPTPDLSVKILHDDGPVRIGQTIQVRFQVTNVGNADAEATTLRVFMGNNLTDNWNVPKLPGGGTFTRTKQLRLASGGIIYWSADVDHDNRIHDRSRTNNSARYDMHIHGPDLVVCYQPPMIVHTLSLDLSVKGGESISVRVRNIGDAPAGPCHVLIFIENRETKEFAVPALAPGASHEVRRYSRWRTTGKHWFRAYVDCRKEVAETQEHNNVLNGEFIKRSNYTIEEPMQEECSGSPSAQAQP